MIKDVDGNLIEMADDGLFDVIAHGCNCFNTMGSGIAKSIKNRWPKVLAADLATTKGDRSKLGTCIPVKCDTIAGGSVDVVNAYTQYRYGRGGPHADYEAVRSCMVWLNENYKGKRVGLPLLAAGLAGGDWSIIYRHIADSLTDCDVTIVHFDG